MKNYHFSIKNMLAVSIVIMANMMFEFQTLSATNIEFTRQNQDSALKVYSGTIIGEKSEPLAYALLSVEKSTISTVSNSEGEFILKVPAGLTAGKLTVSFLGYENREVPITSLSPQGNRIKLQSSQLVLPVLEVISKDPAQIVQKMLYNRDVNYSKSDKLMTAFYREIIRKRNTNISLTEAVVEVYKRAYNSSLSDMASLYKSRKSTDYNKLDTLVFKLMGGPFNNIYLDVMRYPEIVLTDKMTDNYEFKLVKTDAINDRTVFVVEFKPLLHVVEPLYQGLLYIDSESFALARAEFELNLTNNAEATRIFVKKKPVNAKITTTKAQYLIDFNFQDNVWSYAYSRIDLGLKINWNKKLFHTFYNSSIEMAATDWSDDITKKEFRNKTRLNPSVIIQDEASGFSDQAFWGEYNIIEPDKSIENAINKIRKQLDKDK